MKKYRLLKDIPTSHGTEKSGTIYEENSHGVFGYIGKDEKSLGNYSEDFLKQNPEFFEEVKRYQPAKGENYYCIRENGGLSVEIYYCCLDGFDHNRYEEGNCFESKEQAEKARDGVKEYLIKFHEENL